MEARDRALERCAEAKIDRIHLSQVSSHDIDDVIWLRLAKRINELLASPEVDGVVVTHGTNTLEETS